MTSEKLEATVNEHMAFIETLPAKHRDRLEELVRETCERHESIRRDTDRAREALDDWRIAAKYQVFDREARERESSNEGRSHDDVS